MIEPLAIQPLIDSRKRLVSQRLGVQNSIMLLANYNRLNHRRLRVDFLYSILIKPDYNLNC